MARRGLILLLLAPVLALAPTLAFATGLGHVGHARWTDKYDADFRKYSKRYFGPNFDWRWFKAQAIAESNLRPGAYNPSGASGLMQILPSTFKEVQGENPSFTSLSEPRWNIAAGIYYDRYLYHRWRKRVGVSEQHLFYTFASYNAGFSRVSKAYRKTGGEPGEVLPWYKVAPHVPAETREYVKKIHRLMRPAFTRQPNREPGQKSARQFSIQSLLAQIRG